MFRSLSAVTLIAFLATLSYAQDTDLCLAECIDDEESGGEKICVFNLRVDLHASELGYFTVDGCDGKMPTLGIERGVTYVFNQAHETNYYHPLGLAYYADGAHDDVDELEPGIPPPGSASDCAESNSCPAPMYFKNDEYLGVYNNIEGVGPITGDENFGLDDYEPEFFFDFLTWKSEGEYYVALKFDTDDFVQDFFYFCHIHQFMTGRIKIVDENGVALYPDNTPEIPYEYETPSAYDTECGTYGLGEFTLPHEECPDQFVCGKPDGSVGAFAGCLDSMNCAMTSGMTTNVHSDSAIALFNHQMIPHHQNAVNMCKAIIKSGELTCEDLEDEDDYHCQMYHLCYEIINGQNFQIQIMKGILDGMGYAETDDCKVDISNNLLTKSAKGGKSSKHSKESKHSKAGNAGKGGKKRRRILA